MAEYIEREALIRYLKEKKKALENIDCVNMAKDIGRIIKHIEKDKIPVADVVEVRHGYWEDNTNGTFTCSVCGGKAHKMDWCGHCGARMDRGILDPRTATSIEELKEYLDEPDNADRCVSCGTIIPEGRMMCPACEKGNK